MPETMTLPPIGALAEQAQRVTIHPSERALRGHVRLPGSKSITNRALLIAALSRGTSRICGALRSDDTQHMITALRAFGVSISEGDDLKISPPAQWTASGAPLFLGNAGTAMRFLAAAAVLTNGPVKLDGDRHMRKRPIGPLVSALQAAGVAIEAPTGCPPCTVIGSGRFAGGGLRISGALSSQYISALMMIAPLAERPTTLHIAEPRIDASGYLDVTISVMRAFGAKITRRDAQTIGITNSGYRATRLKVEADASAATYFWAAEALTGGQLDLGIAQSEQPDVMARAIMRRFPELPDHINGAQMQDAVPALAVLSAFSNGDVHFTGISNLRHKECDRLQVLHEGLNRMQPGLATLTGNDLIVHGRPTLGRDALDCEIDPHLDHRMAMSFALAGLRCPGVSILAPGCVNKTFPSYWKRLEDLGVILSFA
ncbi:3-phosphoshikimate 1-carboxyvinyltransferase [Salipiger pallidus]|uniref:3-phosphoshikimate 1-carboxyvinyltransferase n=1 Tax=Salipiger pallidus TaxID=1775170 RepID=A0A8J3EGQ9_9RHOB|nr:3-phosphoshikimate 1-carboxyvinyltransferase [Salipiger pallidus]GGG72571.1 3-phosphoshikimate 1-carboxyvinyltransferase [Salipiger pallidus]